MICIALVGINLAYAGAGHRASRPKADCGSLKAMLDNDAVPDDIAKDKLVMQAMMTRCQAALKPTAEHSMSDGYHASPADSGAESNHSMHGSKTNSAQTAKESSPKAKAQPRRWSRPASTLSERTYKKGSTNENFSVLICRGRIRTHRGCGRYLLGCIPHRSRYPSP
jgi:hypothetical protein